MSMGTNAKEDQNNHVKEERSIRMGRGQTASSADQGCGWVGLGRGGEKWSPVTLSTAVAAVTKADS
jgi:hypothetical protein